jgi:hypothetical protein
VTKAGCMNVFVAAASRTRGHFFGGDGHERGRVAHRLGNGDCRPSVRLGGLHVNVTRIRSQKQTRKVAESSRGPVSPRIHLRLAVPKNNFYSRRRSRGNKTISV